MKVISLFGQTYGKGTGHFTPKEVFYRLLEALARCGVGHCGRLARWCMCKRIPWLKEVERSGYI